MAALATTDADKSARPVASCWLYGSGFLIATPIYPWYALPFLVLVIMAGRLEWLSVRAALYVAFIFDHETWVQALAFGTALAVSPLSASFGGAEPGVRAPARKRRH